MPLLAVVLVALILFPGSAAGAVRAARLAGVGAAANGTWGVGTEAVLPGSAATTSQNVSINSVSCASAGNCGAVGTYVDSSGNTQGLMLTETAGAWAAGVKAVLPSNAAATNQFVHLDSVSCASAGNCTAVGSYNDNSGSGEGLLLTETAGTWATGVEAVPPANADKTNQWVHPVSVSCVSAANCVAVGTYFVGGQNNNHALILTETAGSWSAGIEPPLPANASATHDAGLQSVSCASAGNCTAVGGYADSSSIGQGLLLTDTGGAWATGVEAPLPGNAAPVGSSVDSVSCTSAGNCGAVGLYSGGLLLLTETGSTWATGVEGALPANASQSPLVEPTSISCASAGNCAAIATYYDNSANNIREGVMLNQTGGTWGTGVEAALPADADTSIFQAVSLNSVSCPSAGDCSAVGSYNLSSGEGAGLLLTETGGSWATGTQVALPANGSSAPTFVSLNSISCASAGQCGAAGWYGLTTAGGGNQGLLVSTTTTAPQETLTLTDSGAGSGTVTSSPTGIDCGATCSFKFDIGTEVTLTTTPGPHSYLSGWSFPTCGNVGPCQVSMSGATAVTATFDLNSYLVTVQKAGNGSGTVVSTTPDTEMNCGPNCSIGWAWGSQVTLIETPANGSVFTGWSGGGCSGRQKGCQFTVASDTTVTATFAVAPCVVPNLKGKSLAGARTAIFGTYCRLGKVTKKASRKVRKGHVISQSPAPGKHLSQGTRINLVVSKGKRT